MVRSEESAPAPVLLANGTHPGVCRAHRSAASASTMSEDLSDGGDRGDGVRVGSAQPNGLELTLPSFFLALAQISKSPILLRGIRRGRRFGSGTASEGVRFPTSYHSSPSPKLPSRNYRPRNYPEITPASEGVRFSTSYHSSPSPKLPKLRPRNYEITHSYHSSPVPEITEITKLPKLPELP